VVLYYWSDPGTQARAMVEELGLLERRDGAVSRWAAERLGGGRTAYMPYVWGAIRPALLVFARDAELEPGLDRCAGAVEIFWHTRTPFGHVFYFEFSCGPLLVHGYIDPHDPRWGAMLEDMAVTGHLYYAVYYLKEGRAVLKSYGAIGIPVVPAHHINTGLFRAYYDEYTGEISRDFEKAVASAREELLEEFREYEKRAEKKRARSRLLKRSGAALAATAALSSAAAAMALGLDPLASPPLWALYALAASGAAVYVKGWRLAREAEEFYRENLGRARRMGLQV